MTEHALLPPSSAELWANCAMALRMIKDFGVLRLSSGDEDSAPEGTAAHWYVSQCLTDCIPAVDDADSAGTPITQEMAYHGDKLVELVRHYLDDPSRYTVLVEQRAFSGMTINPDVWGTPDIVVVDRQENKVLLFDYKYGFRIVEEYLNEQCVIYLISVMVTLGFNMDVWSASVTIVQPRAFHPRGVARTWEVPAGYLKERAAILKTRAAEALARLQAEKPPHLAEAKAGPWCRDCANHACSVFRESAYGAVAVAGMLHAGAVESDVAHLVLKQWRDAAQTLKHAIAGLEGDLLARVTRGDRVPGVIRENRTTHAKWSVPDEMVIAIGLGAGKNLAKPGTVTPTQARQMGVDEAVISAISHRPPGEAVVKLVSESDARRAFD